MCSTRNQPGCPGWAAQSPSNRLDPRLPSCPHPDSSTVITLKEFSNSPVFSPDPLSITSSRIQITPTRSVSFGLPHQTALFYPQLSRKQTHETLEQSLALPLFCERCIQETEDPISGSLQHTADWPPHAITAPPLSAPPCPRAPAVAP